MTSGLGTKPAIVGGVRKMPLPMVMPTMSAVPLEKPMTLRRSCVRIRRHSIFSDRERNRDALRIGALVDCVEIVDLESLADLIAGGVLEGVERQQIVLARPPGLARREHPPRFRVFDGHVAGDCDVTAHVHRARASINHGRGVWETSRREHCDCPRLEAARCAMSADRAASQRAARPGAPADTPPSEAGRAGRAIRG